MVDVNHGLFATLYPCRYSGCVIFWLRVRSDYKFANTFSAVKWQEVLFLYQIIHGRSIKAVMAVFSWLWDYSLYSHGHENTGWILMAVRIQLFNQRKSTVFVTVDEYYKNMICYFSPRSHTSYISINKKYFYW